MNYELITKAEFDAACAKFAPAKWIVFTFKYFSSSTEKKDLKVSNTIVNTLLVAFFAMMLGVILDMPTKYLIPFVIIYCGLLIPMVGLMFAAAKFNNLRHDKIRKELGGITIDEYMGLVQKFGS